MLLAIQDVGFTKIKKHPRTFSFIKLQNFQSFATCSSRTLPKIHCGLQEIDWSGFTDILQGTCNKFIPLCFHSWLHSITGGNQPQTNACATFSLSFYLCCQQHLISTQFINSNLLSTANLALNSMRTRLYPTFCSFICVLFVLQ